MMNRWVKYAGVVVCLIFSHAMLFAQPHDGKKTSRDASVTLRVEVTSPTTAMFVDLQKSADDNARLGTNQPGKIEIVRNGSVILTWDKSDSERVWRQYHKMDDTSANADKKEKTSTKEKNDVSDNRTKNNSLAPVQTVVPPVETRPPVGTETVIREFDEYMGNDAYFAEDAINGFQNIIDDHISNLRNKTDKDGYIAENELDSYARGERDILMNKREELSSLVSAFLKRYNKSGLVDRDKCEERLTEIVEKKLDRREEALSKLENELGITPPTAKNKEVRWFPIALTILGALLLGGLLVYLVKSRKKTGVNNAPQINPAYTKNTKTANEQPAIVVRRKTTAILKKQSLEDVIDNPAYLPIEVAEFCDNAELRRIYLKNSCIRDIYNMYANDLRQAASPKENGCMVLGRWVYDSQAQEYYVSLEEVVMPGDDAVFQEYELNFGGKIKLRVTDRLRKLRMNTNLQYDLTCWVHSHPGLGVFFSNADNAVHQQLKHPTHPRFLTAMVVDTLTPNQDTGIFVFKRDGAVTSKNDLKRMYSLKQLYQWAVKSEQNMSSGASAPTAPVNNPGTPVNPPVSSPRVVPNIPQHPVQPTPQNAMSQRPVAAQPTDRFNLLANAVQLTNGCHAILMNKYVANDLKMMLDMAVSGRVGFIHGWTRGNNAQEECVIEKVSKSPSIEGLTLTGCLVMTAHLSIPTLRKIVGDCLGRIRFVMVYTQADGLITSIPVVGNDLCTDEHYYGEQKLEDIVSWVRTNR